MEFTNQGSSEDRGSAEAFDNEPENLDIGPIEITASSRGETCVLSASKSSVDCERSNNVCIHTGSVSVKCNMASSSPVSICEKMDSVLIESAKGTPVDTVESSSSTVNNERKPTAKVQTTKKKSVRPKGKFASSVSIDVTEKKKIVSDSGVVRATETRTAEACPVVASTSSTTDSFEVVGVSQGDKTKKRKTRRGKKTQTTEKDQRDGMELSNTEVIDLASLLQTPLGALSLSNGVPDPELVRLMNRIAEVQAGMNSGKAGISGLSQTTSNQPQSGTSKSIDKKKKSKKKAPDTQAGSKSKEKLTFERYIPESEAISGLQKNGLISGAIRINQRNYKDAYINSPDKSQDIMIEGMRNRNRALEGDEVIVRLNPESDWKSQLGTSNKQKTGTVVFIKEKIHPRVGVGFLKLMADKNKDWVQFSPRDSRIPRMRIPAAECPENFYKEADNYKKTLFLARIEEWQDVRFARGTILEQIGDIGDLKAETLALLLENDIETSPYDTRLFQYFPRLPYQIPEEEYNSRADLRKECIFTIDPETAKDLDDAVSCKELDNGNLLIGVHISDVSYFLKEGTPLDLAVSRRATSTYLVEQVYHMLPREMTLLCSLLPGDDKLAFSVFWEMTPAAEIVNHSFTRSIINSCTQLAYEHAQVMLDNPDKEWNENELPRICGNYTAKDLSRVVNHLNRLAVIMRSKRFEGGALRIDQTKLMFALDPRTGLPTAYNVYVNKESHRLIEEFMLLANMTVAARLNKDFPDLAFLRCHPTPHEFVMDELKRSMEQIGVHLDVNSAGGLQASMWRYAGDDFLSTARMMVLNNLCAKPMARAKYFCAKFLEEENYKHYALNVPLYTHFTSPIRRYADVMVHRLLCASLGYSSVPNWDPDNVQKIASTCNKQKYQAKRAGEQSIELFLAIYVGLYGPFVEEAVVMDVKDVSFDIIICSMGFVQRVYTNNNFQTQARVTCITDDNKKIIRQEIEWHPTKTHPYTTRQGVHIFSIVTVELSRSPLTNKVESRLLRPRE